MSLIKQRRSDKIPKPPTTQKRTVGRTKLRRTAAMLREAKWEMKEIVKKQKCILSEFLTRQRKLRRDKSGYVLITDSERLEDRLGVLERGSPFTTALVETLPKGGCAFPPVAPVRSKAVKQLTVSEQRHPRVTDRSKHPCYSCETCSPCQTPFIPPVKLTPRQQDIYIDRLYYIPVRQKAIRKQADQGLTSPLQASQELAQWESRRRRRQKSIIRPKYLFVSMLVNLEPTLPGLRSLVRCRCTDSFVSLPLISI